MKLRDLTLALAGTLILGACTERADSPTSPSMAAGSTAATTWVVAFKQHSGLPDDVDQIVADAGGSIVTRLPEIGGIAVTSADANFGAAMKRNQAVLAVDPATEMHLPDPTTADVGATSAENNGGNYSPAGPDPQPGTEPLYNQQWDKMRMNASATGSYALQQGRKEVVVAILDTGLDGFHPDIAPNLDVARSRSFVPTEPTFQDGNGHGTWCGSAVAAPINGIGVSGVAPKVTLVALKVLAASGSGAFIWLDQALIYAGQNHFDIASMSLSGIFPKNEAHADYRLLVRAVQFARSNGVLPIAALGNRNFDISDGRFFGPFIVAPAEIAGVVGVSATGYRNDKAWYSSYGMGKTDVSAPGGSTRNYTGVPGSGSPPPPYFGIGRVLGAWSTTGNPTGFPDPNLGVEQCTGPGGTPPCFAYAWVQGTSMATPNAAGVAALIISQYGDFDGGGNPNKIHMSPTQVETYLQTSANNQPCPEPRTVLAGPGINPPTVTCEGQVGYNSFFGKGIVDAVKAVTLH